MDGLFSNLKNLDAYSKVNENFYKRTLAGAGGIITIFHITFSALSCSMLSVDAMDISGQQHLDANHDIIKKRIDIHGNVIETKQDRIGHTKIEKPLQKHGGRLEHNETYCGSCYGAESCKREGFLQRIKDEEGEGCNVYGFLEMNKVGGNFYFVPGKSFQQSNMHISHIVNKLVFGENVPSVDNPLDGVKWTQQTVQAMYQYFIKMVPTVYLDINGKMTYTYQFSVTEHLKADNSFGTRIFLECFSTMIFLQSRYLYCFWNFRFIYIPQSKSHKKEARTWQIQLILEISDLVFK
ncbi:putative Endoplasmic reticulum-Golgi intermediate compartment protein,putative [Zostera marina]|uniref:Putative Endoplasmic reticulum-Golgi intermediate compartment protein,putative n=1 Tax=Zostera marina TaxID=29655 RepID=A0A0K9PJ54_ZOSMR|nr:putative Endoplasmic reticulum-Golgi intermediate compartment protein,putative [Zostera marina]